MWWYQLTLCADERRGRRGSPQEVVGGGAHRSEIRRRDKFRTDGSEPTFNVPYPYPATPSGGHGDEECAHAPALACSAHSCTTRRSSAAAQRAQSSSSCLMDFTPCLSP